MLIADEARAILAEETIYAPFDCWGSAEHGL